MLENIIKQINELELNPSMYSEGIITSYGDGIAKANGLQGAGISEIVRIVISEDKWEPALIFNLEQDQVGLIVLNDSKLIKPGLKVISTGYIFDIEVSEKMLGRTINILGEPIDGKGIVSHVNSKRQKVERSAYGVIDRKSVTVPLQTGILAVDALTPIGRGQRQLIIGDRQTGKSSLALDIIINQGNINRKIDNKEFEGKKVYTIYVAIGQKQSKIAQFVKKLEEFGALEYTIVVSASSADSASSQYLAPYVGAAIGEFFMERGDDALIIYDDLSKQAKAYRQISLLLRRPPGREAYPGDIFYLHSRLLERAARLREECGGGSLTALPIIETQAGDVSAYIPTNVISITDGQIYLRSELFNSGVKPAVDVGISVSRVGGNAQIKAMKQVAGSLKLNLAQFRELQTFVQFGVEVDQATQKKIDDGLRLSEVLKQKTYSPLPVEEQVLLLWSVINGYTAKISHKEVVSWGEKLLEYCRSFHKDLLNKIATEQKISEELEAELKQTLDSYTTVN